MEGVGERTHVPRVLFYPDPTEVWIRDTWNSRIFNYEREFTISSDMDRYDLGIGNTLWAGGSGFGIPKETRNNIIFQDIQNVFRTLRVSY